MQSTITIILGQLAMALPMLLVYLAGMVLAAVYWRRAPLAALLAMAGLAVMLASTRA